MVVAAVALVPAVLLVPPVLLVPAVLVAPAMATMGMAALAEDAPPVPTETLPQWGAESPAGGQAWPTSAATHCPLLQVTLTSGAMQAGHIAVGVPRHAASAACSDFVTSHSAVWQ